MILTDLQTKRDALITAMARGLLSASVEGIKVEYQSIEQMRQALAVLNSEIHLLTSPASTRQSFVAHSRG